MDLVRVIAGKYRGRRLKTVKGDQTRPTSDKIKESIFQMIGPFFEGGICLDLFAGSGALGIEGISRGMERAIFIEKDSKAIKVVHDNIKQLGMSDQTEVFRTDAFRSLNVLKKRNIQFDLIFVDPPYGKLNDNEIITQINEKGLLKKRGIIYYEYEITDKSITDQINLSIIKQVDYGTTGVTLFQAN